jgi:septal ring factor EnvC (AmiA/AmiB activator)
MAPARSPKAFARLLVAAGFTLALLPTTGAGAEGPDPAETERQLDEVRAQRGEAELAVDALAAEDAQVRSAIATLETNVATQQAEVDEAERALDAAEAEVEVATANVAIQQERIDELNQTTDAVVVEAFVNPPSDNALDSFKADSLTDAAVKQALVGLQSESDADLLDQFEQAYEDLEIEKANKQMLAAEADEKRATAESELAELENALTQQEAFAADVEERLNAKLAEAESLRAFDASLAEQLEREQAEVAAQLRAAQEAAAAEAAAQGLAAQNATAQGAAAQGAAAPRQGGSPSTITPAPGGLATVTCPFGGSIQVAGSIAGDVQALLDASAAAGVSLCASGGWRSPERQVELRRQHCGDSHYAIYEMPSSMCSPPTARPGSSMHEQGLAIDFSCNGGGAITRGNSCWDFLAAHANGYGLYNLPSEPWHWSVNGN